MPKVAFHTLGCKVNYYETEAVWELFEAAGYEKVDYKSEADVYVINTCTVTNGGDKKSRQIIRRAIRKNPEAIICVMGCYAQTKPKEIMDIEGVDIIIGTHGRDKIIDLVRKYEQERKPINLVSNIWNHTEFETLNVTKFENRRRAALKIQDGCNQFCTFCIIPWARGKVRSEKPETVISQVKELVANGHIEIVLTGIHTAAYGEDFEDYSFGRLLKALTQIDGLKRLRISSIEATEITDEVSEAIQASDVIVDHLHIPIQSGSDDILKAMKRNYTVAEFEAKIHELRVILPNLSLTTDVIVGFPGETDELFAETVATLKRIGFSELHVFPYSVRNGTKAAILPNHVPDFTKTLRVNELLNLNEQLAKNFAANCVDKIFDIIVEEAAEGAHIGHTGNYLKVKFKGSNLSPGDLARVKIINANYPICDGEIV